MKPKLGPWFAMMVVAAAALALFGAYPRTPADAQAQAQGPAQVQAQTPIPRQTLATLIAPDNPFIADGPAQPLPYSHKQHLALGMQCVACHTAPAPGAAMTLPATSTCMGCHANVAKDKPAIKQLAAFHAAGKPVPWVRVYHLMTGVTWSHAVHLKAGMDCASCHGAVRDLPVMQQLKSPNTMDGCLQCHAKAQAAGLKAPERCEGCHAAWAPGMALDTVRTPGPAAPAPEPAKKN